MQNNLHIFIDRLKNDQEEKICDKILIADLEIENEKELMFTTPIEVDAKVYKANEELIINLNINFSIFLPCKVCIAPVQKDIKIKNLYITEKLSCIKTFYDLKKEIKNVCFLHIPVFIECLDSCPKRSNIKKYLKKTDKENFPFSNLKEK